MGKFIVLGIFAMCALAGSARSAQAGCNTDLLDCYERAANIDSFWYRWGAGMDCEFDYVQCARETLLGR